MTRGPVLRRQKQSSRVLRPNWNAVWWPRVFWINMISRASRQRYPSSVRGSRGHLQWTHRGIPLQLVEKYTSWWGSYILPLYDWQRGLLRGQQTEQKTTNIYCQCAHHGDAQAKGLPPSQGINVKPSGLLPSSLVKPTGSFVTGVPADCMARATTSFIHYYYYYYYYYYYNHHHHHHYHYY